MIKEAKMNREITYRNRKEGKARRQCWEDLLWTRITEMYVIDLRSVHISLEKPF